MNLSRARVLIVGLGVSGHGVVEALKSSGAQLSLAEDAEELRRAVIPNSDFECSGTIAELIDAPWDLVVVSPGIPPERLGRDPLAGKVIGELELGWLLADAPVSAITGTNGKTSVTTLTAMMLGENAILCGNAGISFAAVAQSAASRYVVEASSFQLTWAPTFSPASATWTNFTPDHLDWHGSLEEYRQAKAKLFTQLASGSVAILNADDPVVLATELPEGVRRLTFSIESEGDYMLRHGSLVGPNDVELMPVANLGRSGPIAVSNALAAWATADVAGADLGQVRATLEEFTGLEHRQEFVGEDNGIIYVNDSKATTPVAAAAGIMSFDNVVLIAGGRGKGLSFEPMAAVADRVRSVVAIGECGPEIAELFRSHNVPSKLASSMDEAVTLASAEARPGDVVLLGPGAASFDWYRSYAYRGLDFKALVHERLTKGSELIRERSTGSSPVHDRRGGVERDQRSIRRREEK
jgi:UDP-N-acetylmuramoylalanine--D-glutamate ligase